ncbi:hypothetical protein BOH78_4238 [Pichia kudriavzevii]|uniref:BZIP domain-containing protein n=1 Tax=Pichia kudriavzevii TaxID=4909 RepID=A0A1V2LJ14_PICKU|nr:hypothetical protein BOH78_4238 [Pichia kudriavzevii]
MPPKFDPSEVKYLYLRAVGGEVGASSALAPKIGPLGLSPKKVGEDIAKATKDFKGIKVTVQLKIQNRQATASVVPSASSLVITALKEAPRDRKKDKNVKHSGNIPLDEIFEIARTMREKSFGKTLASVTKEILGTAQSVGCRVDNKPPHDIIEAIDAGAIDDQFTDYSPSCSLYPFLFVHCLKQYLGFGHWDPLGDWYLDLGIPLNWMVLNFGRHFVTNIVNIMEVNTDKAFVEAVLVIKSLTDLSKKSNLPRPTIDDRLNLYGLYSQATKGDINSNEPDGNRISEVRKYNAWKAFKGLTRKEARRQYCKYLLDVLKNNYSQEKYPIVSPLRDRLQEMWDMLENHNLSLSIGESVHLGSPILPDSLTQTLTATTTSATTLPPPQPTNGVSFNTPSYNIPPRAQSPAVSLFRMASSGINPSMIRPPSRNHSVSISRKNSVGATNYNNSNSNPLAKASTNIPTDSHHADLTTGNSIQHFNNVVDTDNCAVSSYNVEKHINSLDFLKWQGEINNTLLKISTELANLKYRQISTDTSSKTKLNLENVEQRNFTGSTTLSCVLLRNWLGGFFARDMELLKWGSLTDVGESFPHTQALSPLGDCPLRDQRKMPSTKTQENAAVEKPHSKPGRKALTSEPKNKRTAQNRAAQRAFRERKEKRMKELEEKVQALEKEKMLLANESELLRHQVLTLMKQVKGSQGIDGNHGIDINTNTSVSPEVKLDTSSEAWDTSNDGKSSFYESSSSSVHSNTPVSFGNDYMAKMTTPKESSVGNLELTNKLNNADFKDNYDEQIFCTELSTACGSKSCPIPRGKMEKHGQSISSEYSDSHGPTREKDAKHVPTTYSGSSCQSMTSSSSVTSPEFPSPPSQVKGNVLNHDTSHFSTPFLNDGKVNEGIDSLDNIESPNWNFDFGHFDNKQPSVIPTNRENEMDFLLSTNDFNNNFISKNPAAFQLDPTSAVFVDPVSNDFEVDFDDNAFDELLKIPQGEEEVEVPLALQAGNTSKENIHSGSPKVVDKKEDEETVPDTNGNLIKCSQIWERITTNPRFTDLDIDNLCDELKQKAKCSENGVVVDSADVGKLLQSAIREKQENTQREREVALKRLAIANSSGGSILQGLW